MTAAVATEAGAPTAVVPLGALRDALTWVLPAAAKPSDGIPALAAVHITLTAHDAPTLPTFGADWHARQPTAKPGGSVLTLAATDRYRAHWAAIVLDSPIPGESFDVMLPAAELAAAAKAWPRDRGLIPGEASLLLTEAGWDVRATADGATAQRTILPEEGTFPQLDRIVQGLAERLPDPTDSAAFNPRYLADLATAAVRIAGKSGTPLRMRGTTKQLPSGKGTEPGPALLQLRPSESRVEYSALLMPVRLPA